MKIKNFPPIIFNGNLTKDPETFSLTFKKLNSALSIDDDFDKRSKSKEDLDEIFKSKEDFDDGKKKSSSEKTNYESQNLITSNLL